MINLDMLPMAIGIAISPVPVIAVIIMLFSGRAKSNGIAFASAWFLTIAILSVGIVFFASTNEVVTTTESGTQWIKLILGIVLLLMAVKNFHARPKEGQEPDMPTWLVKIDGFTPLKASGLAALLSGLNPKNLALIIAGAVTIAESGSINNTTWINVGLFVTIASFSVVVPVVYYLFAGQKAKQTLTKWKEWLSQNNAMVMFGLFLVVGILLLLQGFNVI